MWFRFLLSRACVACACAGGRYAAGRRRDQRREPVGVRRHGRHRAGQLPLSLSPFPSSSSSPSVFLTPSFSPSFSFSSSLSLCLPLSSSLFLSLMILTRSPHPTPAADFGAPSANVPHALTPYTPPFSLAPFRTRSLARSLTAMREQEMAGIFASSPYIHVGCDETSTPPTLPGYPAFAQQVRPLSHCRLLPAYTGREGGGVFSLHSLCGRSFCALELIWPGTALRVYCCLPGMARMPDASREAAPLTGPRRQSPAPPPSLRPRISQQEERERIPPPLYAVQAGMQRGWG